MFHKNLWLEEQLPSLHSRKFKKKAVNAEAGIRDNVLLMRVHKSAAFPFTLISIPMPLTKQFLS
jgi:hypothetical protein